MPLFFNRPRAARRWGTALLQAALLGLAFGAACATGGRAEVPAPVLTVLHTFGSRNGNTDGSYPDAGLLSPGDGFLYGTTYQGANGAGVVFRTRTDGSGFITLHAFAALDPDTGANADGAQPEAGLVAPGDGFLYGTTIFGGASGHGVVFRLHGDGTGFAVTHTFSGLGPPSSNADGASPQSSLIAPGDGFLYGTTCYGGARGVGVVFRMSPDGAAFNDLHDFGYSDGAYPAAALLAPGDGYLYGTTVQGGANSTGTLFRVGRDGTGFLSLYSFTSLDSTGHNADGVQPEAALYTPGDGYFYGTANNGGAGAGQLGRGTVFRFRTDGTVAGTHFQTLYSFSCPDAATSRNPDGAFPSTALTAGGDGFLYGVTSAAGPNGNGTVFRLHADGSGFETDYAFSATDGLGHTTDGSNPVAGLLLLGGSLYGMTNEGGPNATGTVFRLSLPAPSTTHLLWDNADGRSALWDVQGDGTATVRAAYGPYEDDGTAQTLWRAVALSTGPDGVSHLLWDNPNGKAALWDVDSAGGVTAVTAYGPYPDGPSGTLWQARALSVGPDGVRHLLWANPDGRAALWDVGSDGTATVRAGYGPYDDGSAGTPWTALALATGPDGVSHLLWDDRDGRAALWSVDGAGGISSVSGYGPYTDGSPDSPWLAVALSVGGDGVPRLLWDDLDGKSVLWDVHATGGIDIPAVYGPYTDGTPGAPWTAVAVSAGPDGVPHLLWDDRDGRVALWSLDAAGNPASVTGYGPYTDGSPDTPWTAVAVSVGP